MQGKANRRAGGDHAVIGEHAPAEGTLMRILLAVDGSDYTNRMLSYLTKHKDWSNAGHAFTVFHLVLPVPHRAAAFAGPEVVHGYYEDDARMVLEPVRELLARNGIQAHFEHRVGHPAEEIASFAQKGQFDLVECGRSRLRRVRARQRHGGVVAGAVMPGAGADRDVGRRFRPWPQHGCCSSNSFDDSWRPTPCVPRRKKCCTSNFFTPLQGDRLSIIAQKDFVCRKREKEVLSCCG